MRKGHAHGTSRSGYYEEYSDFSGNSDYAELSDGITEDPGHNRMLFQEALHLFRIVAKDEFIPYLDDRRPEMPGLCDYHISCVFIRCEINLNEFHIFRAEVLLYFMAVMTSRG